MLFGLFGSEEKKGYVDCSKIKTGIHSRCLAAKVLIQKFSGNNSSDINEEDFNKFKNIAEELCGIQELIYDPDKKYIDFSNSKINENVEYPVLTTGKLVSMTVEELISIAPKLKCYETEKDDSKDDSDVIDNIKNLGKDNMESINKVIDIIRKADKRLKNVSLEDQIKMSKKILENKEFMNVIKEFIPIDDIVKCVNEFSTEFKDNDKTDSNTEIINEKSQESSKLVEEKSEEKNNPQTQVTPELMTQEDFESEKKKIVEIKKSTKTTDEKIQEAISEGVEKGDIKVTTPDKQKEDLVKEEHENKTGESNHKFMATFADKIKSGMTEYQSKMFDKVMKKMEDLVNKDWGEDIKLTNVLVKRFDKENKLITFLFENDSKNTPLVEVFYFTGNNRQLTNKYKSANDFVDALKARKEAAKKDEKLKSKCYNVNFNSIPGYVVVK